MEIKSFALFLYELINQFAYEDFSPENSQAVHVKFKDKFYLDTPYWTPCAESQTSFSIDFKKYGENRRRISLKFSFGNRELVLEIKDKDKLEREDKRGADISKTIQYSEIWKDHCVLYKGLHEIMKEGLRLAEETM